MPPRYKPTSEMTEHQRQRLFEPLTHLLVMKFLLPSLCTCFLSLVFIVSFIRLSYPQIDVESVRFIIVILLLWTAFAGVVSMLFFAWMIRWLIGYRQKRLGRVRALRMVLKPSDANPTLRRRMLLRLWGVYEADLMMLDMIWELDEVD